jgi:hypothetical protein
MKEQDQIERCRAEPVAALLLHDIVLELEAELMAD